MFRWRDHLAAFGGQDAGSSSVYVREKSALDAAEEQADAFALFPLGGRDICHCFDRRGSGEQGLHGGDSFRQSFEDAYSAQCGLRAALLVDQQGPAQEFHPAGLGERFEQQSAVQFFGGGALVIAFDLGARGLDQFSVINAGGTGGHAGDAAEAGIKMADPAFVHLRFAFESELHQVDPAAR